MNGGRVDVNGIMQECRNNGILEDWKNGIEDVNGIMM